MPLRAPSSPAAGRSSRPPRAAPPRRRRSTVPAGSPSNASRRWRGARELAVAPNGDLFVGTSGNAVVLVADAQGTPRQRRSRSCSSTTRRSPASTLDGERMILGAQFGVYELPYRSGDRTPRAQPRKIAAVRTSGDRADHVTTSVAVANGHALCERRLVVQQLRSRSRRDARDDSADGARRQRHDAEGAPHSQRDRARDEPGDRARCGPASPDRTSSRTAIPTRSSMP